MTDNFKATPRALCRRSYKIGSEDSQTSPAHLCAVRLACKANQPLDGVFARA